MTTGTYARPNYTTDLAATYKARIDAMARVFERFGDWFAPHEQSAGSPSPDLTIVVDAGFIWDGTTLSEKGQQTVTGFTIPASGTRIDRICINETNGDALRVAGTAVAGSPSATPPAIPDGYMPCCQVSIASTDTAVSNAMITDERVLGGTTGGASETAAGTVELATAAEIKTGSDTGRAMSPQRLRDAIGFSAYFQSAAQTITAAGALTIAHGLARKPILIQQILINVTGEADYVTDDEVPAMFTGDDNSRGAAVVPDATNLNVRFGSTAGVYVVLHKTTGVVTAITAANWKVIFRAWA